MSKVTEQVSDHQGRTLASWTQPVLHPHTLPARLLQPVFYGSDGTCLMLL